MTGKEGVMDALLWKFCQVRFSELISVLVLSKCKQKKMFSNEILYNEVYIRIFYDVW